MLINGPLPGGGGAAAAADPSVVHYKASTAARGSTNTAINQYQTEIENSGSDLTPSNSATLGFGVTVNTAGRYQVMASFTSTAELSIKKNTSIVNSLSVTDTDMIAGFMSGGYNSQFVEVLCAENDVIFVASSGGIAAYPELCQFYMKGPL